MRIGPRDSHETAEKLGFQGFLCNPKSTGPISDVTNLASCHQAKICRCPPSELDALSSHVCLSTAVHRYSAHLVISSAWKSIAIDKRRCSWYSVSSSSGCFAITPLILRNFTERSFSRNNTKWLYGDTQWTWARWWGRVALTRWKSHSVRVSAGMIFTPLKLSVCPFQMTVYFNCNNDRNLNVLHLHCSTERYRSRAQIIGLGASFTNQHPWPLYVTSWSLIATVDKSLMTENRFLSEGALHSGKMFLLEPHRPRFLQVIHWHFCLTVTSQVDFM